MSLPLVFRSLAIRSKKKRAVVIAVLVLALVGGLTQAAFWGWVRCHPPGKEEHRQIGVDVLTPKKEEGFETWKSRQIGTESVSEFSLARTAPLLIADVPFHFEPPRLDGESGQTYKADQSANLSIGRATATAISGDGYWLTVAHALPLEYAYLADYEIGDEPPHLISVQGLHRVRVVWKGALDDPHLPDLALIHCSLRSDRYFSMDDSAPVSRGTEVLAAGLGNGQPGLSSGEILRGGPDKAPGNGARWKECLSDAPIIPGDSGGPLFTTGGQLIGINVGDRFSIRLFLFGPKQIYDCQVKTVCPDWAWIRQLIERDRELAGDGEREEPEGD